MTNREYLEKVKGISDFKAFYLSGDPYSVIIQPYCSGRRLCPIASTDFGDGTDDPCYICFMQWLDEEHKERKRHERI